VATQTTTIVVKADTSQAERALGRLNGALGALVTAASITAFARFSDSIANLQNKLSLVTQEGQTASDAFKVVAKSAINLGAPLKDVGDLFFRVANNTRDLGLAQTDQIKITETLIKGFQLTGATAGEVAGGVVQLGQAFAVGVLRGDELNSVLESLPLVAQALADKFGVQTGALKALGEQGRITSKDLSDAILTSGESIDKAWGNKLPTIEAQFNRFQTALGVAFQSANNGIGISEALGFALLKITVALVKVIKFFEDWGGTLKTVLSILAGLAAFTIVGRVLSAIGAAASGVAGAFGILAGGAASLRTTFSILSSNISKFAQGLIPADKMVGVLGRRFGWLAEGVKMLLGPIIALGSGLAAVLGVDALFPKDKQEAVKTQKQLIDELNKSLGLDNVEASKNARAASEALTAQQLKDADAVRKANITRGESLKDINRTLEGERVLTGFIGQELTVQTAIYNANRSLIKEIKNDKGEIIGYTKGLSAEEEKNLAILVRQNEELKRQQTIRQNVARATTPLQGSSAGVEVSGQLPNLAPVQAAMTANETLFNGLEYLRQNDLISEQAYQAAKVNAAVQAQAAIMEATSKQYEAQALLRIQAQTGNQFGYETQKAMAREAADFEKRSTLEKTQFGIEQGAMLFNALGAQNKKAFELAKAFNIANAIMNTYMAATKALATYPPPINFAMAAVAVGMGMAQVAQIRSQTYSGRALGGPVMGNNPYIVGENGPELFTPSTSGNITRNDQLGSGGPVNINFNIQTNDAEGFDDLLTQRKGMIQQFVADAMLERGQRSKM
jgi:tape measure domain-containing protein